MGGKPNPGTPKDRRLGANKRGAGSSKGKSSKAHAWAWGLVLRTGLATVPCRRQHDVAHQLAAGWHTAHLTPLARLSLRLP